MRIFTMPIKRENVWESGRRRTVRCLSGKIVFNIFSLWYLIVHAMPIFQISLIFNIHLTLECIHPNKVSIIIFCLAIQQWCFEREEKFTLLDIFPLRFCRILAVSIPTLGSWWWRWGFKKILLFHSGKDEAIEIWLKNYMNF
jgi:hypothetical protein